jgi:hypothetical protein
MRNLTIALCALLLVLALPLHAQPRDGEWTGWITDDSCGAKGAKAEHKACAEKCLGNGGTLVLYNPADEQLYKLDNQELAKEHLGHEVIVKGSVEGTTIKIKSIAAKEG